MFGNSINVAYQLLTSSDVCLGKCKLHVWYGNDVCVCVDSCCKVRGKETTAADSRLI